MVCVSLFQVQEILEGAKVLEWLRERAEIEYITRWEREINDSKMIIGRDLGINLISEIFVRLCKIPCHFCSVKNIL